MHSPPSLRVITSNGTLVSLLCENSPTTSPCETSSVSPPSASFEELCPEQNFEDKLLSHRHPSALSRDNCPTTSCTPDRFPPHAKAGVGRPRSSTCSEIFLSGTTTDITSRKTTSCPTSPIRLSGEPFGSGTKRKYQCGYPSCFKTFTTSGHLARHNRIHTKEKNFSCLMAGCSSKFSRKDNMMQHYRTHTTVKLRNHIADAVSPQVHGYGVRQTRAHPYPAKNHSYGHSDTASNNCSPSSKIPNTTNHSLRLPPPNNLFPMPYPRSAFSSCQLPDDNLFTHRLSYPTFPIPCNIPTYLRGRTDPPVLEIPPIRLASNQDARPSFATQSTLLHSPQLADPKGSHVLFDRYNKEREIHLQISMRNYATVEPERRAPSENPTGLHQLADLAHIVAALG